MLRSLSRSLGLVIGLFVVVPCVRAVAQATVILEEPGYTPTLVFDVATVRLSPPPDANFHVSVTSPPDSSRFEATNVPMFALLKIAYGYESPVVGAPDWANNTFYDIKARSDEAEDARLAKLPLNEVRLEKRHAIRQLMAERFGVKLHTETRVTSIYHLVIAKGGLKMTAVPAAPVGEDGKRPPMRPSDVQVHGSQHGLEFVGSSSPLLAISSALSSMVEVPVKDMTGLTGVYNYTLQFGRDWSQRDPDSWPDILTAVQEQLGLKLESAKEPVPNLVVDAMTKPTEN